MPFSWMHLLQESAAKHRFQLGRDGKPVTNLARGWWQFEKWGGHAGVLRHSSTGPYAMRLAEELGFDPTIEACWDALPYSELLAAGFARLLLWSDHRPLPAAIPANEDAGWDYYLRNWRPGKPHRDRWTANWSEALRLCGDF